MCIIPVLCVYLLQLLLLYPLSFLKYFYYLLHIYMYKYDMTVCPEEESILMTSFVDSLSHLQDKESKLIIY